MQRTFSVQDASTVKHINSILHAPWSLLGSGLGGGANVFTDVKSYQAGEGIFNRVLLETGVAGFGLLLFVLAVLIRTAFRSPEPEVGPQDTEQQRLAETFCLMGGGYLIVMIPSLFITVNLFSAVSHGFFWLVLGLGFQLRLSADMSYSEQVPLPVRRYR